MCLSPDSFSIIKDVIVSIAAIVTASIAVFGITSWRRELKGKSDFDAARRLMKSTYMLRDSISAARDPLISGYEFPEDYEGALGETTAEDKAKAYFHVFNNRWKPIIEALQEFDTAALEAEAIWGAEIKVKTNTFRKTLNKLQASKQMHVQNMLHDNNYLDENMAQTIHRDLFDTVRMGEENQLSNDIEAAIKAIEEEARPHLKR